MVTFKQKSLRKFVLGAAILLLLNYLSGFFFIRYDLTSEKRYTLSPVTKSILKNIENPIFVEVYLDGDLPSGFQRLQTQCKEMLDEFRVYSDYIGYHIVNPLEGRNSQEQQYILNALSEKGLQPTDLQVKTYEGTEQKLIVPGAIMGNGKLEVPINLLNDQIGVPPETILNNSIQSLEYKLINGIKKLNKNRISKVALISGHGEMDYPYLVDLAITLDENYILHQIPLNGEINALLEDSTGTVEPKYDAIIIAKPVSRFDEKDKFVIDQYAMHGGNILWLIDPVIASLDSLQKAEQALVFPYDLNLEDLLFTYGVRLNNNLIKDINCLPIPLKSGQMGHQAQIQFFPWAFYPVVHPMAQHPVVRNLNAIKTEFVSNIDTIAVKDVKKTVLLKTSQNSNLFNIPATISFSMVNDEMNPQPYQSGSQIISVLLEGKFKSVFKNRIPPLKGFTPKEKSKGSKMIVVSDGDLAKNQLQMSSKEPLPLGYDQFTRQTFGNKEFLLNAISYLTDGADLINLRSREIKLRLLDKAKIKEDGFKWKIINVVLPIVFIMLFGMLYFIYRKRKYSSFK